MLHQTRERRLQSGHDEWEQRRDDDQHPDIDVAFGVGGSTDRVFEDGDSALVEPIRRRVL